MCQKICSFMQHQREISRKLKIQNNMMEKMLFHLVTSPSVHMHENCYFCSTLLSLYNERCPQWNWCSFIITFICMILFYGQRLVNYNFLLCRISNKKGNTKFYYLVVVIMIEKKFFSLKRILTRVFYFLWLNVKQVKSNALNSGAGSVEQVAAVCVVLVSVYVYFHFGGRYVYSRPQHLIWRDIKFNYLLLLFWLCRYLLFTFQRRIVYIYLLFYVYWYF